MIHKYTHMGLDFSINNWYPIIYIEFFGVKIDTQLVAVTKNKPLRAIIENIFIKGRIELRWCLFANSWFEGDDSNWMNPAWICVLRLPKTIVLTMAACSTSSTLGVPEAKKVVNPPAVSDSNGMISRDLSSAASVNLFLDFHSRMKELVSWPLTEAAKVSDVHELEPILQAIFEAMWEMKTHEYIENHYIMDQLKSRLQSRRVSTYVLQSTLTFCFYK